MTYVFYVCFTKDGKSFTTRSYSEAQKVKAEGGKYAVRYEEHHTL